MTPPGRDGSDAMVALERLYAKNVVTLEEAQAAARLISGDASIVFPPPAAKTPPAPPAAVGPAPPADAPASPPPSAPPE